MKPLPPAVRTVLKTAAEQPKERRVHAINRSVAWAKKYFPEYFQNVRVEDLPPIKMPTLTKYLETLKNTQFKEITK